MNYKHFQISYVENHSIFHHVKFHQYGFNLSFEGGEAETLIINCPLFSHSLKINKFNKIWDGYRGIFEIVEAKLDNNA